MEGDLGLGLVLLALLLFGWGGLFSWRRFRRDESAVDPKGAYPGDPKARALGRVLDAVAQSITSDLERTEMSYHPGDPREVMTLTMDIEQFRHLRKHRGMWQYEGIFVERDIERRWTRRPRAVREWEGMAFVIPIAIKAAFDADVCLRTVRFWVGDMENYALTICRLSVEAKRSQSPSGYDWRFDKRAKGYLAPVTPHGERPPSLAAVGLAEDPYDFEQQVAQMLRGRGLTVEVTGGTGDEGVDIIAHDDTPVTGGTILVQCKRYSLDKKVGVAEVRELYGTMQEKQSAKGVLVTSSAFTTGALRFAEGKSIELIDGPRLSELLVGIVQPVQSVQPMQPVPDAFLQAKYDFSEPASEERKEEGMEERLIEQWRAQARENAVPLVQHNYCRAAADGDLEALSAAIRNGVDLNSRLEGVPALILAISNRHTEAVEMLVTSGTGIDLGIRNVDGGFTPLHFAVLTIQPQIIDLLIDNGADVDVLSDEGQSALAVSIYRLLQPDINGLDITIMEKLVAAGADTQQAYRMAADVELPESILEVLRPR